MNLPILESQYSAIERRAKRLELALSMELSELLLNDDLTLGVPIESRVKSWASIVEKVERKSLGLQHVQDLDDLVGVRIILLFRQDLLSVDELLRSTLTVISSEDTSLKLADAQFGYQSQHYIVEVPVSWLEMPTWKSLGGIRVEIQVRTLAQHIWAVASHKLQYKHEASVPLPLRRSINRVSALLEIVDIEFDRFLDERLSYVGVKEDWDDPSTILNVEVLGAVLSEIFPERNRREDEPYDELIVDLNHFGINTVGDLTRITKKHMQRVMASDVFHAKKQQRSEGFYFKHVGLAREALRKEFGERIVSAFMKLRK